MTSKYAEYKVGHKFGYWELIYEGMSSTSQNPKPKFSVRCICGTEKSVDAQSLVHGKSKSCGCRGNISKISNTTIYRNLTRAKQLGEVKDLDYKTLSDLLISQSGQCVVSNETLNDSNAKLAKIDISQPFQANNVAWVTNTVAPLTVKTGIIGVVNASNFSSAQTTNIFEKIGMRRINNTTGDTNESK